MAKCLALGSYHRSLARSSRCFREYRAPFPSPAASCGTLYNALLPDRHYQGNRSYPAHQPWDNAYSMAALDRKSTRLNSSHVSISYAVFCLKKKTKEDTEKCLSSYTTDW